MAGNVLEVLTMLQPDRLGTEIANTFITWNGLRQEKVLAWEELRKYVYATDTTQTTNAKLPWKNKTTIPKLCQIRDNLFANYMAVLHPKRKNMIWEAATRQADTKEKRTAITNYMASVVAEPSYKAELAKLVLDYIDYGNCFATVDWVDDRVEVKDLLTSTAAPERVQVGYVGPALRRISPLDIVFNPIASSFERSPKIIKSLVSLGEVKEYLERLSTDETKDSYEELYKYLLDIRKQVAGFQGEVRSKDTFLQMDGFTSFQAYLGSNYCELLTFYGDIYDPDTDTFLKNHIVTVVDRHKIIDKRPNPSILGKPPIFHVGWRVRQDNLWAMGPLDNLIGLQYRIDHIENLKADVFDLIAAPPLKIKGYVEDFEWGPFAKIHTSEDGDVDMIVPAYQVLQANIEIQNLAAIMEEMAGSPKEAMGFRTPGEKTKYEVTRLENAASRIFQNKTGQFEEVFVEPVNNAMLEMGRRKITSDISIKVFDNELNAAVFMDLKKEDLAGQGRIRCVGARHFAEQAELIQNLTGLSQSPLFQTVLPHISSVSLFQMLEDVFDIKDYKIFTPYAAIAEQAEIQRLTQSLQEQISTEATTPSGLTPDDYDLDPAEQEMQNAQMAQMMAQQQGG